MNQKKVYMIFIFVLMLFPMMILAKDTCNSNDIKIKSIDLKESNGFSEEVEEANINNNIINLNLEMYNVGESITYKIKVKNNSNNDYYFTKDSFNLNTDHIEYEILNNSAVIKPNEEKEIELKITYKNKTPEDEFNENNRMSITLSDTPLSNPSTKRSLVLILLIVGTTTILAFVGEKKLIEKFMIVIFVILTVPLVTHASCTINLEINANITINEKEAIFLPGKEVNVKMKELAGDDTSTSTNPYTFQDENITAIKYSNTEPVDSEKQEKNIVSTIDSPYPIYMWYEEGTIYWWSEAKHPKLNKDSSIFMYNLSSLNEVTSISLWDVSSIVNMQSMFYGTALVNLYDIKDWNIENVENLTYTFSHMEHLTDIKGLSNWNTKNINSLQNSFSFDSSLVDLSGLENWDTSKVENMNLTFAMNVSLVSLEPIKNWDTSNVKIFSSMFSLDKSINNLSPLSNWNVSNANDYRAMFAGCTTINDLNGLKNWDVSAGKVFGNMFYNCINLEDVSAINDWNIKEGYNFQGMFKNLNIHPEFSKVPGTWDSTGTFTPTP